MHTFVDYTKKYLKSDIILDKQTSIRSLWIYEHGQNLQIQTWPEFNKCVMSSNIVKIVNK